MLAACSSKTDPKQSGNVWATMRYNSIGSIAKLGQKEDIYSNIFNQIDRDQNGSLDKEEFRDATKALNLSLTETELIEIYNSISDKNGVITLKSFTKFIKKSVMIHKQFISLQQQFKTSIINKIKLIKSPSTTPNIMNEGDPLLTQNNDTNNNNNNNDNNSSFQEPIYQQIFNHIKLNKIQKIDNEYGIQLNLLTDKNRKNCFIGYCQTIQNVNNNEHTTFDGNNHDYNKTDKTDEKDRKNEYTKMEKIGLSDDTETNKIIFDNERNNISNLIYQSQIICLNNISCQDIGYDQVINIINNTDLPHTIIFRKTIGIAIEKRRNKRQHDSYDDYEEYSETASIHDSEKYVVHDRTKSYEDEDDDNIHCKYCPDKSKHKLLFMLHRTMEDESYSKLSFCIITYIMICIILSTITYVVETLPSIQQNEKAVFVFLIIEFIVSISFTLEYLLRIIACKNRWKYFIDTMNLIDFLAVIPFWIEILSGSAGANILRVIRVVRLARVIRLMKSDRFIEYLNVFGATIKRSSESFGLLSALISLQIILFGSLFYVIEAGSNPLFSSIPMGAFYTVVTITTVGYGMYNTFCIYFCIYLF